MSEIKDRVSKTLFIPLSMKARDYLSKDSILKDKFSYELSQRVEFDVINEFKHSFFSFIGTNLRSKYIDDECINLAKHMQNPIIVNLGCGLDTRFQRVKESIENAVFYELDLPEVIALKKEIFSQNANLISNSMFDTSWMDELRQKHQDSEFIFTIEGVLMYFSKEQIKELFSNLSQRFKGYIIADLMNVWMSKNQKNHDVLKDVDVKLGEGFDNLKELESDKIKLIRDISVLEIDKKRYKFIGKLFRMFKNIKDSLRICTYGMQKT